MQQPFATIGVLATAAVLTALVLAAAAPADDGGSMTKTESFDRDPGWEGFNNHVVPDRIPTVAQDFGYSGASNFAGKGQGEIGGTLTRASRPAYYAAVIEPKTLNDPLRASGTFAMTKSGAAGAMFFGWFNAKQPQANGRPTNSLGFELGTEKTGGRLMVHAITGSNQTAGRFVTRFEMYRTKEEQAERRTPDYHVDEHGVGSHFEPSVSFLKCGLVT
jgi:hypothetical protein